MTERDQATAPGSARDAADRLRTALEAHLAAVEARVGEHDPQVQRAYRELRAAAADYDEALYCEHDEVTPFDLPDLDDGAEAGARAAAPDLRRLSLVARWDFTVADPDRLVAAGSDALGDPVADPGVALAALAARGGHTQLTAPGVAETVGLRGHGGTTWVLPCADAGPDEPGSEWTEDAFIDAVPERVHCRFDQPPPG